MTATATPTAPPFKMTDFASDQDVRWCPGCGDYSILAAVKQTLATLPIPPHQYCFISGIGCSSRFPYYMGTYGIHGIHGRAAAIATGFKISRPEIQTWIVTGDGDGLSIGGNHTMHAMRRNVDLKILLFNNRIYGLTKGQYSPTSEMGKKTKSSPMGTVDSPIEPIALALAAGATFIARTYDTNVAHIREVLTRAHQHKGAAFVEIYQNCNIFNDMAFDMFTEKSVRSDRMIVLRHGKPMIFGANSDKGIVFRDYKPTVVTIGQDGVTEKDIAVHDDNGPEGVAMMLARMQYPDFPVAIGIFRSNASRAPFDALLNDQVGQAKKLFPTSLQKVLDGEDTYFVEAREKGTHVPAAATALHN